LSQGDSLVLDAGRWRRLVARHVESELKKTAKKNEVSTDQPLSKARTSSQHRGSARRRRETRRQD
jgi:hypothetical protein